MTFTVSELNQFGHTAITVAAGAYMSGSSFLMPVSHMLAAPVVAYAIGAELAPIALGAYAVMHGIKYGYKVFSESESSSSVALAKATVGGLLAAGTSAAVAVAACNIAASKLAEDVGGLVSHGVDMLLNGKTESNCAPLHMDIAKVVFDVAAPVSDFFECCTFGKAAEVVSELWNTGKVEQGNCATLFGLSALAVNEVSKFIGECPMSEPGVNVAGLKTLSGIFYDICF